MPTRFFLNEAAEAHLAQELLPYHELADRMALFKNSLQDYRQRHGWLIRHDSDVRAALDWLEDGIDGARSSLPNLRKKRMALEESLAPEEMPDYFTRSMEDY